MQNRDLYGKHQSHDNHDSIAESAKRDKFTRRGSLNCSAALAGRRYRAGRWPRTGARSDPGPGNRCLMPRTRIPCGRPARTPRAWSNVQVSVLPSEQAVYEGGWSREVTVRELPVSKSMAGVNMRLTAGGVRELHWHTAGEWAIMLYGTARITAIDANGRVLSPM